MSAYLSTCLAILTHTSTQQWAGASNTGLLYRHPWLVTWLCPGSLPLDREKHTEHRLSTEPEELPPTPHHLGEQSVQAESGHKETHPRGSPSKGTSGDYGGDPEDGNLWSPVIRDLPGRPDGVHPARGSADDTARDRVAGRGAAHRAMYGKVSQTAVTADATRDSQRRRVPAPTWSPYTATRGGRHPGRPCSLPPAVASCTTPRLQRTKMDSEEATGILVSAPRTHRDGEDKKNPRPA